MKKLTPEENLIKRKVYEKIDALNGRFGANIPKYVVHINEVNDNIFNIISDEIGIKFI